MDDLISRLSELRCQYNCFDENERDAYHTLSEAIKALSDVPDTNVGDTIDRQAAIDVQERFVKDCNPEHFVGHQKFIEYMDNAEIGSFGNWQYANGFNIGLTVAEVAIKELPSAEPKRRKGRWLIEYLDGIPGRRAEIKYCSECYQVSPYRHNFCPNCGADMRGE